MKIEMVDEQIDAIIINEMKRIIKWTKQDMKSNSTHPEDKEYAKSVRKAAKIILDYHGG